MLKITNHSNQPIYLFAVFNYYKTETIQTQKTIKV
jgi:hypothetical protein